MQHCCGLLHNRGTMGHNTCILCILEKISPSELVSNGYISNHNKMRRPRLKFNVSFYLYFCCFWINVTQINSENIRRKIQRIFSESCFQLKSWFNFDARAPSIPLLNFPFKNSMSPDSSRLCQWIVLVHGKNENLCIFCFVNAEFYRVVWTIN